jgi:uncharacterized membrane protein
MNQPNSPYTLIVLILAAIAILGSKNKKKAFLVIGGSIIGAFAIGFLVAVFEQNPDLGGSIGGLIILVVGGITSIRQLIINRRERND